MPETELKPTADQIEAQIYEAISRAELAKRELLEALDASRIRAHPVHDLPEIQKSMRQLGTAMNQFGLAETAARKAHHLWARFIGTGALILILILTGCFHRQTIDPLDLPVIPISHSCTLVTVSGIVFTYKPVNGHCLSAKAILKTLKQTAEGE